MGSGLEALFCQGPCHFLFAQLLRRKIFFVLKFLASTLFHSTAYMAKLSALYQLLWLLAAQIYKCYYLLILLETTVDVTDLNNLRYLLP